MRPFIPHCQITCFTLRYQDLNHFSCKRLLNNVAKIIKNQCFKTSAKGEFINYSLNGYRKS